MEKTVKKIISTMVDVSPKTMDELKKMDISDPQKAIDFVVRVAFAQIDHINDGIDDIKKLDIANTLSKISSTQILYQELCENSRIAEHNYNEIHIKIIEANNELKNKIPIYVGYITDIYHAPVWKNILAGGTRLRRMNSNVMHAKIAIHALSIAVNIYVTLAPELNITNTNAVISDYCDFIDATLLSNNNIEIMKEFDEKNHAFWDQIPERKKDACIASKSIEKLLKMKDGGI